MKPQSRSAAVLLATLLITSITTDVNAAGRTTKSVANTILNGKGAPKKSVGIDGDFYIDIRSLLIYGPKAKGKWPTPANLQGPTGPSGNDGKNGNDGKTVSTNATSTARGEQGATGPQGVQGLQGLPGEKGEKGDAGLPGLPGASGPAGSPGSAGPTGAQGPAGATGAAGPSEVTVVDIPQWILSSGAPFSYGNSAPFGNLQAGKSYFFMIHINGTSSFNNLILGLELISTNGTLKYSFSRNDFRFATSNATSSGYVFDIYGTLQNGDSNSTLTVRVIDGLGDTGTGPLTLTGKAYITLVGAIR